MEPNTRSLEEYPKLSLSSPRRVPLTILSIETRQAKSGGAHSTVLGLVQNISVKTLNSGSIGRAVIQREAIEHIEELDRQVAAEALAKVELLAERDILIKVWRRRQATNGGSHVSNGPVSRWSERRGIDHGQPFVVVVPVDVEVV